MRKQFVTRLAAQLPALLALVALLASLGLAQNDASAIRKELKTIQDGLDKIPVTDPQLKEFKAGSEESIVQASTDLDAGRVYASLDELTQARDLFLALQITQNHVGGRNTMADFQAEWDKTGLELTALDQKWRERNWSNIPVAVRALSEVEQSKMLGLLRASRASALATNQENKPEYRFINLGEAKASAESSAFCYSLNLGGHGAPLPLRSVLPELQRLQERATAAFQPPRSIEQHDTFIEVNSAIKLAGDLDGARLYAGALLQYLAAVRDLGVLDAGALDAAKQSQVRRAVAEMDARLKNSARDDSIAQIFVEQAQELLARKGSVPSQDGWKRIASIMDQALPAYFAVLAAPPQPEEKAAGVIRVTLVRWPYT